VGNRLQKVSPFQPNTYTQYIDMPKELSVLKRSLQSRYQKSKDLVTQNNIAIKILLELFQYFL
jgi:hypothetical protein